MNLEVLKKHKYALGVAVVILALIVYKLRFLPLPYYWDEAWPYGVAVRTMQAHGLSLMPGSISTFVARGHPLMFHFLAAGWMNIFGTSLISGHSFALFVSVLLLIVVYLFCKAFFSERVGFVACLLLATQAIFICQSVFLMPEMLLALWAMLCLYAFFKDKKILFIVFGSYLLLTKESGAVLIVTLGFSEIIKYFSSKEKSLLYLLSRLLLIAAPVFIASIYFIIQRIKYGWFLYPFYMDYIKDDRHETFRKITDILAYFFVYSGRNGLSFFLILSLIFLFIVKKIKLPDNEKKILLVLSCFILSFFIFSAVNYYIPRYLLCILPPLIIILTVIIDKAISLIQFSGRKIMYVLLITGFVITDVFYYMTNRNTDRNYAPALKTTIKMVDYCEKQKLYTSNILTTCVLSYDFTMPYVGFISGQPFTHVTSEFTDQTLYCIFAGEEYDNVLVNNIKKYNRLQPVMRFEEDNDWVELYKVSR